MPLKVKRKTLAARDIGRRRKRFSSYSDFGRPGAGVALAVQTREGLMVARHLD